MNAGTRYDGLAKAVRDCVVLKPGKGLVRRRIWRLNGVIATTFVPDEIISRLALALTPSNRPKVASAWIHLTAQKKYAINWSAFAAVCF